MTRFSDEQMQAAMTQTREYTVVVLEAGPQYGTEAAKPVIWEHGRRNFELRADGILNIVCRITDAAHARDSGSAGASPSPARMPLLARYVISHGWLHLILLCGVGIFTGTADDVRRIMDDDPGVRAGVFTYRIHPTRSFPGDALQG